jgi:hypothetical protein
MLSQSQAVGRPSLTLSDATNFVLTYQGRAALDSSRRDEIASRRSVPKAKVT